MKKFLMLLILMFILRISYINAQCTVTPFYIHPDSLAKGAMMPKVIRFCVGDIDAIPVQILPMRKYEYEGYLFDVDSFKLNSFSPSLPSWMEVITLDPNQMYRGGVWTCSVVSPVSSVPAVVPAGQDSVMFKYALNVTAWFKVGGVQVVQNATPTDSLKIVFYKRVGGVCTVGRLPESAGTITGASSVCRGQYGVTYSVPEINYATSYIWTLPSGATGTSSTNNISVNYGTSTVSGNITVKGHNILGDGASSSKYVNVNSSPLPPTVTTPITYYQNAPSSPLTATGSNLLWYTASIGGIGTSTAPTPSTANTGSVSYYVTQTTSTCESPRAEIVVNVIPITCNKPAPTTTGASRCGNGSLALSASGGLSYLWYNAASGGNIVNVGPLYNTPSLSNTTTYYVSNFDSCESIRTAVVARILQLNIEAGANKTINCGSSVTLTTSTHYNGTNTLVYAWTPSTGLSATNIASPVANPSQTTTYTVMVSDGVCSYYDNVIVNVNPIGIGVDFSASPQLINNPPFATQFTNLTPNLSNYNFTWHFGDGISLQSNNSTVFHQYSQNGLYDVTLEASDISTGCTETLYRSDWIFCAGGNVCSHTASITQSSPVNGCVGTPIVLTCNSVSGATYQWNYNGIAIPNAYGTSYYANASGSYSVTIILNGCPVTSSLVVVNLNIPPATPTINTTGTLTYCGGGSVTLEAPAGYASYLWSNGASTQSITVIVSGNYNVRVSDVNGCSAQSSPLLIGASPQANPDICIVSVDNITGKNMVIWNKSVTSAIAQYNIYAEGSQANVFDLLGSVPYSSLSVFTDNASNPAQQAYRYKLSAVDTCGAETSLSDYHKSIHLTINQGMGNTYNLIWSYYEGFTFPSYKIYSGTSPSNLTLLTTIASTLNSYTDLTPPAGNVYYQIEAVNPNPCTPSKSTYNSTRSNIASNSTTNINNNTSVESNFKIYPNPANEYIFIESPIINTNKTSSIKIYSSDGQLIINETSTNTLTTINVKKFAKGIYFVKVENVDDFMVKKFVKE